MSEGTGGGVESLVITFPSPLRIRQQLGHISTNRIFKRELVPSIEQFGGQKLSVASFVTSLETKLFAYAEENLHGITSLALGDMPRIIDTLVQEEPQRTAALDLWQERALERKEESREDIERLRVRRQREIERIRQNLDTRPDKQPRRLKPKKGKTKGEDERERAMQRGVSASIYPGGMRPRSLRNQRKR